MFKCKERFNFKTVFFKGICKKVFSIVKALEYLKRKIKKTKYGINKINVITGKKCMNLAEHLFVTQILSWK